MSPDLIPGRLEKLLSVTRFGKFISVGASGATVETAVVTFLTVAFGVYGLFAKALGVEASVTFMFLVNEHWTFTEEGDSGRRSFFGRYLRSHLVRSGGITVAFLVYAALLHLVDVTVIIRGSDFWPAIANVISIGVAFPMNYVAEGLFTWRVGVE
jgi:putative flippase GtrA